MKMIMQTSMSGPDLQLVKGQPYTATPIEAVRLFLAIFATVDPEDQGEFEAAMAAYEAEQDVLGVGLKGGPSLSNEAAAKAAADAKVEAKRIADKAAAKAVADKGKK